MDQLIIKYLEKNSSEEEQKALLNWIHESEANKKYFFEMRDLWITTSHTVTNRLNQRNAFNRFKQNVFAYEKSKQKKATGIKYLKYAASIVIFIGFSLGMYIIGNKNVEYRNKEKIINHIITGADKTTLTLSDGTIVYMHSNSKIYYPDQFEENMRLVQLEGEAYFEVKHNKSVPFFVETKEMVVKVLGTEFDMRSYTDEPLAETILLSGKVEVTLGEDKEVIILSPNQKISLDKQSGNHYIENVDASEYALWKNNRLIMNNEELETIFRKIERWYNIDIYYDKNLPLRSRYSITITDEPKEEIFRLLSIVAPIKYKVENEKITVKRK